MTIELRDHIFNFGASLVLNGEKGLVDADLSQLDEFPEEQRAGITSVVLSDTNITGECFRYLRSLPNLKALYVNKTRVNDDAPIECLPKTMEILNLDHSEVGDVCVSKLSILPNLHTVRLLQTGITNHSIHILATMESLLECHFDDTPVNVYARQRLRNAMDLRARNFNKAVLLLLYGIQLAARKLTLRYMGMNRIC